MFSLVFFSFCQAQCFNRIWKYIVFKESSETELFLKSFDRKDDRQNTNVFMCFVSCPQQPSVLENVYRLP